jgi:hypothetical protein
MIEDDESEAQFRGLETLDTARSNAHAISNDDNINPKPNNEGNKAIANP